MRWPDYRLGRLRSVAHSGESEMQSSKETQPEGWGKSVQKIRGLFRDIS